MPDPTRCFCNNCGRSTDHELLVSKSVDDSDEPDPDDEFQPFYWTDTYDTLQCRGCGSVCLRHTVDDAAGEHRVFFYPPAVARRPPLWRFRLPEQMWQLLDEIYKALHNNSRRLALMGARTLVDMLMSAEVGDVGSFNHKLDALRDKGVISQRNRDILFAALDAGSAAAHRGFNPAHDELNAVIDIVENLLEATYHLSYVADEIRKKVPPRS